MSSSKAAAMPAHEVHSGRYGNGWVRLFVQNEINETYVARVEFDARTFQLDQGGFSEARMVLSESNPNLVLLLITITNCFLPEDCPIGLTALTRVPADGIVFPTALHAIMIDYDLSTQTTYLFGAMVLP
jgi:hypothetical protein